MNYHNITNHDMKNGDGLRVVLWVSGCLHKCTNCQNPVTWDENSGLPFDEEAERELFEKLGKDYISGLTLSGGDPLFPGNEEEVTGLVCRVKERFPDKTIWLYTGYYFEDIQDKQIMKYIDVLVDGKYIDALRDVKLKWRGSSNQRVIDVSASIGGKTVLHCD